MRAVDKVSSEKIYWTIIGTDSSYCPVKIYFGRHVSGKTRHILSFIRALFVLADTRPGFRSMCSSVPRHVILTLADTMLVHKSL